MKYYKVIYSWTLTANYTHIYPLIEKKYLYFIKDNNIIPMQINL